MENHLLFKWSKIYWDKSKSTIISVLARKYMNSSVARMKHKQLVEQYLSEGSGFDGK